MTSVDKNGDTHGSGLPRFSLQRKSMTTKGEKRRKLGAAFCISPEEEEYEQKLRKEAKTSSTESEDIAVEEKVEANNEVQEEPDQKLFRGLFEDTYDTSVQEIQVVQKKPERSRGLFEEADDASVQELDFDKLPIENVTRRKNIADQHFSSGRSRGNGGDDVFSENDFSIPSDESLFSQPDISELPLCGEMKDWGEQFSEKKCQSEVGSQPSSIDFDNDSHSSLPIKRVSLKIPAVKLPLGGQISIYPEDIASIDNTQRQDTSSDQEEDTAGPDNSKPMQSIPSEASDSNRNGTDPCPTDSERLDDLLLLKEQKTLSDANPVSPCPSSPDNVTIEDNHARPKTLEPEATSLAARKGTKKASCAFDADAVMVEEYNTLMNGATAVGHALDPSKKKSEMNNRKRIMKVYKDIKSPAEKKRTSTKRRACDSQKSSTSDFEFPDSVPTLANVRPKREKKGYSARKKPRDGANQTTMDMFVVKKNKGDQSLANETLEHQAIEDLSNTSTSSIPVEVMSAITEDIQDQKRVQDHNQALLEQYKSKYKHLEHLEEKYRNEEKSRMKREAQEKRERQQNSRLMEDLHAKLDPSQMGELVEKHSEYLNRLWYMTEPGSWRLQDWREGGTTRRALKDRIITHPFSHNQLTAAVKVMEHRWMNTPALYAKKQDFMWTVMLPEFFIRIYADIFKLDIKEAEQRIRTTPLLDTQDQAL